MFVYSPVVDFSKAEGELLERSSLALDSQEAKLTIDPILTTDEGEYKCEITFLDISKNCPVVQLVKLTTLARPQYANISLSRGQSSRPVMANSVVSGRLILSRKKCDCVLFRLVCSMTIVITIFRLVQ